MKDLTTVIVKSVPELEKMLFAGMKNRKTGETAMNKDSSRSHSIFTIYIETAEPINVYKFSLTVSNIGWFWEIEDQSRKT